MGDILEHLSREDARNLLNKLKDKCRELWNSLTTRFGWYHYGRTLSNVRND
jgi:hypothetical protein